MTVALAAAGQRPASARRALLVYMPFGLIQIPSLGLSLLKAGLQRDGIECDVRYLNLEFVDRFCEAPATHAAARYVEATQRYPLAFCAEARFSDLLFGPDVARQQRVDELEADLDPGERRWLGAIGEAAGPFIDWCLEAVAWQQYALVGFSSVFLGMTVPSMLLAHRLKERYPWLVTVIGGPNSEGLMGIELARRFPQADYVLRGEADETLPLLAHDVLANRPIRPLPGLVYRDPQTDEVRSQSAVLVSDLEALPVPDCEEFVQTALATGFGDRYRRRLEIPFESSRGCWWGETSHCKFCGINGQSMSYRSKSPERMLAELAELVRRYEPHALVAADAILDHAYYRDFLPRLASRGNRVPISYEIKANVRRSHVRELAAAGVAEIQPGIEALSTRLLRLVGKGSTTLENLQCLRLSEEYGLRVSWYHLVGLPGEQLADYEAELELLRLVSHLQPPKEIARFTLQRFSPYFDQASEHGLRDVRAMGAYQAVFPFSRESLDALAYHFDFEHADGRTSEQTKRIEDVLRAAILRWKATYGHARLDSAEIDGGLIVSDSRFERRAVYVLDRIGARIYGLLERPRGLRAIVDALLDEPARGQSVLDALLGPLHARAPGLAEGDATIMALPTPPVLTWTREVHVATEAVERVLEQLAERGLIWTEGARSIALAVPLGPGSADPPAAAPPVEVGAR